MTVRGRVDCYINPSDASLGRRNQEIFANITGFLSGSVLTDLGITIVSYSTGSGPGRGLDFWDARESNTGASANNFTWVCYRFNNAPRGKFDMFLLIASASGQSLSPFNVSQNGGTVFGANNSFGIVGWACAVHPSGSVASTVSGGPWNGPILAPGSGTLGTPIWATASNGGQPAVFPRANANDGSFAASRNYLTEMHDDGQFTIPMRMHLIATEGSFTCVQDYGLANSYRVFHFGSYNPRPGTTPASESPYFMWEGQTGPGTNNSNKLYGSFTFGGSAGTSFNNGGDGGVTVPTVASGTKNVAFVTVGNNNIDTNIGSFNSFVNSGSYEFLPFYVCANDTGFNGILGTADYIGFGWGMVPGTVNNVSGTCALGPSTGGTLKLLLPWTGSSPGTVNNVRTGRSF